MPAHSRDGRSALEADVIIAGGGNAALCAAIEAAAAGVRVLVLERAPEHLRGGNSRHTRNIRYLHDERTAYVTGPYRRDEFLDDLLRVGGGQANRPHAEMAIEQSRGVPEWMARQGVRWQQALRGTLHLSRTNLFFLGGGKALVNTYYDRALRLGVRVCYDAAATGVEDRGERCLVLAEIAGERRTIPCRALVVAAGGFEANIDWLARYWGDAARRFLIRGTPYNDGTMLAALLARGARPVGDPKGFHALAIDARSPRFDGGIVTRVDSLPFGIVVNRDGRRFYDEGEDIWPKRYAIWGRLVAEQPEQIAYSVFDAKSWGRFIPPAYPPYRGDTIGALAAHLDLDRAQFAATVDAFNRGAPAGARIDMSRLDGSATSGVAPPKTNWASRLDAPPFYAFPVRPGITFTYLGVEVDVETRVITASGAPMPHVYAAGECMSGNILLSGYLGGFGLTIGTVFGRIAGRAAAAHAMGRDAGAGTAAVANRVRA
ncbi:MAG TPA: FAD-dependent tricarballylate dehydrogenase TcuA [bacterium]|nr:FAD-dependent tricarballylate dehydrogenase TcuA [bacterium]